MTFEPVRYVLPRFIVEGVTLLVGRPKVGKSWWVLDLCLGCAAGLVTHGKLNAMEGDVLYLALEDGKRRLQKRLDKLLPTFSGEWPDRLKLVPMGGWRRADQGGLDDIEAWCQSVPKPVLIVIDTLERFRKPANGKSPLYSSDYEAITGLQQIGGKYQVAIVVLHHDRKSDADDAFDTVSGTLGLTGAADTILIIKRRPNGVVLYARGRDIEESETAMQFDKQTCRWTILGVAADVLQSNERTKIIAALTSAGQALTIREIMAEAETSNRNATDILLGKMVRDGQIVRVGRGRYDLSPTIGGKIGQKERLNGQAIDSAAKTSNLSNLSDLSARTSQAPLSGS
jgi:RecA-family ATPase